MPSTDTCHSIYESLRSQRVASGRGGATSGRPCVRRFAPHVQPGARCIRNGPTVLVGRALPAGSWFGRHRHVRHESAGSVGPAQAGLRRLLAKLRRAVPALRLARAAAAVPARRNPIYAQLAETAPWTARAKAGLRATLCRTGDLWPEHQFGGFTPPRHKSADAIDGDPQRCARHLPGQPR